MKKIAFIIGILIVSNFVYGQQNEVKQTTVNPTNVNSTKLKQQNGNNVKANATEGQKEINQIKTNNTNGKINATTNTNNTTNPSKDVKTIAPRDESK